MNWGEKSRILLLTHIGKEVFPTFTFLLSREVRCVIHTPINESSIPFLREAVCVRMSSYSTIASG